MNRLHYYEFHSAFSLIFAAVLFSAWWCETELNNTAARGQ